MEVKRKKDGNVKVVLTAAEAVTLFELLNVSHDIPVTSYDENSTGVSKYDAETMSESLWERLNNVMGLGF